MEKLTTEDFRQIDGMETKVIWNSLDSSMHVVYVERNDGSGCTVEDVEDAFSWRESCGHEHDCCGCTFACHVECVRELQNGYQTGKQFMVVLEYHRNY